MLIGVLAGIFYAAFGFRGEGEPPVVALTFGPFTDGMLVVKGFHVHHWVVYATITPIAYSAGLCNVTAFCLVMLIRGLSYDDAFVFVRPVSPGIETLSCPVVGDTNAP